MKTVICRFWAFICCLIMATSVCGAVDEEGIPQLVGDGSTENPYQIKNADDLYWFAEHINHGNENEKCITLQINEYDIFFNSSYEKK